MQDRNWYQIAGSIAICKSCGWQHRISALNEGDGCTYCRNVSGIPEHEGEKPAVDANLPSTILRYNNGVIR